MGTRLQLLVLFAAVLLGAAYLLTNDDPYASIAYFSPAVYLLIIDSATGAVQVRDIGGGANGNGECKTVEN